MIHAAGGGGGGGGHHLYFNSMQILLELASMHEYMLKKSCHRVVKIKLHDRASEAFAHVCVSE